MKKTCANVFQSGLARRVMGEARSSWKALKSIKVVSAWNRETHGVVNEPRRFQLLDCGMLGISHFKTYMKFEIRKLGVSSLVKKHYPFFDVESPWSAWTSSNTHIHRSNTPTPETSRPTCSNTFYRWCTFPKIKFDNNIFQRSCRKTRRYCYVERSC